MSSNYRKCHFCFQKYTLSRILEVAKRNLFYYINHQCHPSKDSVLPKKLLQQYQLDTFHQYTSSDINKTSLFLMYTNEHIQFLLPTTEKIQVHNYKNILTQNSLWHISSWQTRSSAKFVNAAYHLLSIIIIL